MSPSAPKRRRRVSFGRNACENVPSGVGRVACVFQVRRSIGAEVWYLERCCLAIRVTGTFSSSAGGRAPSGADTVVQLRAVLEVSAMILFLIVVVLMVALAVRLFRGLLFGGFGWGNPMWGGWFGGPGMWGGWGCGWGWGGPGPRGGGMRPGPGGGPGGPGGPGGGPR